MAALAPETKAKRVRRHERELAKVQKRLDSWEDRETRAREALARFTPERKAALEKRYTVAEKALNYVALAPVKDDDEAAYEEELNRLREADEADVDDEELVDA